MGIKSTYSIERKLAIEIIELKIVELNNNQLSVVLELFAESFYRNHIVFDKLPEQIDENRVIKTFHEF